MRLLVDTNVFLYARGGDHPYRDPCRAVLRAAGEGKVELVASVEVFQELAHVLLRQRSDRLGVVDEVDEARSLCRLYAFDRHVLQIALDLVARYEQLGVRDAVHAGTAIAAGVTSLVSADRAFDTVAEVRRIDPRDLRAPWVAPNP